MADNQDNNDSEVEDIIHPDAPVITEAESTRVMQVDLEKEMKKVKSTELKLRLLSA